MVNLEREASKAPSAKKFGKATRTGTRTHHMLGPGISEEIYLPPEKVHLKGAARRINRAGRRRKVMQILEGMERVQGIRRKSGY